MWPFFAIIRVNLVYTAIPPHLCHMENANNLGSSRPQGGTEPAAPSLTAQYMDWKVDWAFKKVFADKEVMMKLLRDILREDIVDLEYLPNEIPVVSEKDKRSMFCLLYTSDAADE